ncbi:MAG: ferrochelatase [Solirubrobacteraceae bacterium]|jgi:ferrochelatase
MTVAVLAMAYGTPPSPDQVEAYYTHIRRGRAPSSAQLIELQARYAAIGGVSPLREITLAQLGALEAALRQAGRDDLRVALGFKHAAPFIEDSVGELVREGVERIVGVVFAPHFSALSIGEYTERVRAAAPERVAVSVVRDWHLAPPYLGLLSDSVRVVLANLPPQLQAGTQVLFTAHSLPARILESDDPYPTQLRETAAAIAESLQLERWGIAWQSAGRTPEPWVGPDLLDVLNELAQHGVRAVVVCPAGFVADHLEVLYDLDIEARARAQALGIEFARTASPNASPRLADAVAGAVLSELAAVGS